MKAALLPLLLAVTAVAQTEPAGPYDAAAKAILDRCDAAEQKADPAEVKVWPGVIADRKAHTVTVLSAATGIKADDPLEFYVAPIDSGKDYESLAVTPAKPSNVAAALEFIGLTPGRPIDPAKNRFWARGPRLKVSYVAGGKPIVADAIIDLSDGGKAVPSELLFAGSYTRTDPQGEKHYAADVADARPLAPDYEDPAAVLAVPRRAPQGVVYGAQKRGPALDWKRGDAVDVVLTPVPGAGATEDISLRLLLGLTDGKPTITRVGVGDGGQRSMTMQHLVDLIDTPRGDLFTTVEVDPAVPVSEVRKFYAILQLGEHDHGIKLDEPPVGQLYPRAFFPDPAWRKREDRRSEPWELFLGRTDGKLSGKLERLADDPDGPPGSPPKLSSQAVTDAGAFEKIVNASPSKWSRTVFVYPPADLTYGELMAWVGPVLKTYPLVFVFPPETPATTQSGH